MKQDDDTVRVAAIQAAPVFLDRDGSLEKAVNLIKQAASKGASLAAFGESWLPGYPIHAWGSGASALWWELAAEHLDEAVDIPGSTTDALCAVARESGTDVVIGVSERDPITHGSAYSTLLLIGRDGDILGRHRKLKPAPHERAVWADGDAVDLQVHDRGYAYVSTLNSCEHQMVLPTYALAEQGTQIHIAAWPGGEGPPTEGALTMSSPQHLLSRAFAAQTGTYVVCAAGGLTSDDIPEKYRKYLTHDLTGDSIIVDPRGDIIAGPAKQETILTADCPLALIRAAKVAFDCSGHSSRRDQLKLWHPDSDPYAPATSPESEPDYTAEHDTRVHNSSGQSALLRLAGT